MKSMEANRIPASRAKEYFDNLRKQEKIPIHEVRVENLILGGTFWLNIVKNLK